MFFMALSPSPCLLLAIVYIFFSPGKARGQRKVIRQNARGGRYWWVACIIMRSSSRSNGLQPSRSLWMPPVKARARSQFQSGSFSMMMAAGCNPLIAQRLPDLSSTLIMYNSQAYSCFPSLVQLMETHSRFIKNRLVARSDFDSTTMTQTWSWRYI